MIPLTAYGCLRWWRYRARMRCWLLKPLPKAERTSPRTVVLCRTGGATLPGKVWLRPTPECSRLNEGACRRVKRNPFNKNTIEKYYVKYLELLKKEEE